MGIKKYTAGLYLRLSKDDERAGESISIENQRLLLTKYADEQGWEIGGIYVDDGWRGVHFERPGFKRMMEDVKNKKINVIAVKDLSRLGRNYVEIGRLTEETLPQFGCRFVAVNDSVDTMLEDNDIVPYKNLFNEYYSKDTSKKIRTVKRACMEQGKYLGTYAPFGYKKDPQNKYRLIIDDETSYIVKKMFAMRCGGMSYRAIATAFNEEKIPSPKEIYYSRAGRQNPKTENGIWSGQSVKSMLRNEAYIGNLVQGKVGTLSYKNPKLVSKSKDEWIRAANTHEPIIDEETWKIVRSLEEKNFKPRQTGGGAENMFAGLLRCADCGFTMRINVEKAAKKDGSAVQYVSYFCGNYSRSGKSACTAHIIYESALNQLVLDDIRRHARSVVCDEQRVIDGVLKAGNQENRTFTAMYKQELKSSEARVSELDKIIGTLYEDRVNKVITESQFKNLISKYDGEREEKVQKAKILRGKIEKNENENLNVDSWVKTIKKYSEIESLSQDILIELVDKIEVYEAEKVNGRRLCKVKISYRFVGCVNRPPHGEKESEEESHEQAI